MLPDAMFAAVLYRPGDLRYEEVPTPRPQPGQVVVRVAAAGHCGSDLPRIMTTGTHTFPTIPGHELCGRVAETGAGVDVSWTGRRAALIPLIPCGRCAYCAAGMAHLCLSAGYLGSRTNGGYAQYVAAPASNLVPLPDDLDDDEGAALEPIAVSLHALRRAGGIVPGGDVVVLGAGPIGAFIVQWAKALGAGPVLVADIDAAKLDVARALGADVVLDPERDDLVGAVQDFSGGLGAELVVEASGSRAAQRRTADLSRKHGRVVFVGISHEEIRISDELIFRKELALFGSFNSTFGIPGSDWETALAFVSARRVTVKPLITHRLPLCDAPAVYRAMHEGRFPHHKVIFIP